MINRLVNVVMPKLLAALLPAVLGFGLSAAAFGHGVPFVVEVVNGNLVVTEGADVNGLQVFAHSANTFNATTGFTSAPGWEFAPELNDSVLKMVVLDKLFFWDPIDGLAGTTSSNLIARRLFFDTPDHVEVGQGAIVDGESTVWDLPALNSGSHHIIRYELPTDAKVGAYGLLLQLVDITPQDANAIEAAAVLGPSNTFLTVFNQGLNATPDPNNPQVPTDYQHGVDAIAGLASVPEPAGVVVFALGAALVGIGCWGRRR